jgi:LEA14-like dessication related protein
VNSDEIVIKQWSWNQNGIAMDIFVPVSVYNPNYVPLTLSLSQCNIYYAGEHFAYGKPLSRTKFASGVTTNVTVEILLLESMRNNSYISNALTTECGYPPSSSKSVQMDLKATVKVTIVADDISVPFSSTFTLPCAI